MTNREIVDALSKARAPALNEAIPRVFDNRPLRGIGQCIDPSVDCTTYPAYDITGEGRPTAGTA